MSGVHSVLNSTDFTLRNERRRGEELDCLFHFSLKRWGEWYGNAIELVSEQSAADFERTIAAAMNDRQDANLRADLEGLRFS